MPCQLLPCRYVGMTSLGKYVDFIVGQRIKIASFVWCAGYDIDKHPKRGAPCKRGAWGEGPTCPALGPALASWNKGKNVTSARRQVTQCDPYDMWVPMKLVANCYTPCLFYWLFYTWLANRPWCSSSVCSRGWAPQWSQRHIADSSRECHVTCR